MCVREKKREREREKRINKWIVENGSAGDINRYWGRKRETERISETERKKEKTNDRENERENEW